jgi:hypothetical protein
MNTTQGSTTGYDERINALIARVRRELGAIDSSHVIIAEEGGVVGTQTRPLVWWTLKQLDLLEVMRDIERPGAQPEGHVPCVLIFPRERIGVTWLRVALLSQGGDA